MVKVYDDDFALGNDGVVAFPHEDMFDGKT
jgi:hypothetical protein